MGAFKQIDIEKRDTKEDIVDYSITVILKKYCGDEYEFSLMQDSLWVCKTSNQACSWIAAKEFCSYVFNTNKDIATLGQRALHGNKAARAILNTISKEDK